MRDGERTDGCAACDQRALGSTVRKGTHAGDRGGHHRHLTSTDTTASTTSCTDTTHSAAFTADTDLTTRRIPPT